MPKRLSLFNYESLVHAIAAVTVSNYLKTTLNCSLYNYLKNINKL